MKLTLPSAPAQRFPLSNFPPQARARTRIPSPKSSPASGRERESQLSISESLREFHIKDVGLLEKLGLLVSHRQPNPAGHGIQKLVRSVAPRIEMVATLGI